MGNDSEWLSIVNPSVPPNYRVSKQQLLQWSKMFIDQSLKIIKDCADIVNKTKAPDTFFSRFDLMLEKLYKFTLLQKYVPMTFFRGIVPHKKYSEIYYMRENETNTMIERYWQDTLAKANALKTEKAKQNKIQTFFRTMSAFAPKMTTANIEFIAAKGKLIE